MSEHRSSEPAAHSVLEGQSEKTTVPEPECCKTNPLRQPEAVSPQLQDSPVYKGLGWLDRLLALWILLAIIIGILLGNFVPGIEQALQRGQLVDVSVPIAVGLLVMMYPILCKVKFETLHKVFSERGIWIQLGFSLVINWIVAPLLMVSRELAPNFANCHD